MASMISAWATLAKSLTDSDLKFIKSLEPDDAFKSDFLKAIRKVAREVALDKERASVKAERVEMWSQANDVMGAAALLRGRILAGSLTETLTFDALQEYGFDDVFLEKVGRFLNLVFQETWADANQRDSQFPKQWRKTSLPTASWWVGWICARNGLPRPTAYASIDHDSASPSVRLCRILFFAASGRRRSEKTIRNQMDFAQEAYDSTVNRMPDPTRVALD